MTPQQQSKRHKDITTCAAALGREELAKHLANNTSVSVLQAMSILSRAARRPLSLAEKIAAKSAAENGRRSARGALR